MILLEVTAIREELGFCWIADLPPSIVSGDTSDVRPSSELLLFEDRQELGPRRSLHAAIREVGQGAYSHWERQLFFSTSDNSDPRSNGRVYRILARADGERPSRESHSSNADAPPVNYQSAKRGPEQIASDAEYAINCAKTYVGQCPDGRDHLRGRSILEVGPGQNFGSALILRCWGARRVAVTDRFLAGFDASYHVPLYEDIARRLKALEPNADVSPLLACVEAGAYPSEIIGAQEAPLEEIVTHSSERFDVTFSNAVFEHLFDPLAAFTGLREITAPGGTGYHQVDFRDHRDFSRPLEYLLPDELGFARMFHERNGECGNRVRPHQMEIMFKLAGFREVRFTSNMAVESPYLEDFVRRLRASPLSPYKESDSTSLQDVGGCFALALG